MLVDVLFDEDDYDDPNEPMMEGSDENFSDLTQTLMICTIYSTQVSHQLHAQQTALTPRVYQ